MNFPFTLLQYYYTLDHMISLFPALNDNYGFLLHEPKSGLTAAIDTPDGQEIARQCEKHGWKLSHVFNTHHHYDHIGGNEFLKQKYGVKIIAPKAEKNKIPLVDIWLEDGECFAFGKYEVKFIATPGHTLGHGVYYIADEQALFSGDCLFLMGCGRLFEGTAKQMYASLQKLKKLPANTKIYPAHEYTLANAEFALNIDPDNKDLQTAAQKAKTAKLAGLPSVPGSLAEELKTNPFLRARSAEEFASLRAAKDVF